MDAAIPADAQNAPTGIWKSRTEREIPTAPTPIIVVVNERKNNGDSNSVAKPSTESDQAHRGTLSTNTGTAYSGLRCTLREFDHVASFLRILVAVVRIPMIVQRRDTGTAELPTFLWPHEQRTAA